jgi:hypothetical protein
MPWPAKIADHASSASVSFGEVYLDGSYTVRVSVRRRLNPSLDLVSDLRLIFGL